MGASSSLDRPFQRLGAPCGFLLHCWNLDRCGWRFNRRSAVPLPVEKAPAKGSRQVVKHRRPPTAGFYAESTDDTRCELPVPIEGRFDEAELRDQSFFDDAERGAALIRGSLTDPMPTPATCTI
jgi:hypothetical protein